MAFIGAISDLTNPVIMRPDLPPAIATGKHFEPIKLPDFCLKISLSSYVKPDNVWGLFELFLFRD